MEDNKAKIKKKEILFDKKSSRPAYNGGEAKIYSQKGKEIGSLTLPEELFGLPWNADLVHQVLTSMESNRRAGTADTKNRAEVRGGGKKPWRQKGTGRARHGSIRSPLWRGGGITHGPLAERSYKKKINKKMKAKVFLTLLSEKYREGKIIFLDDIKLPAQKTKEAFSVLESIANVPGFKTVTHKKEKNVAIFVPDKKDLNRSFRNIFQADIFSMGDINPLALKDSRYIVITRPSDAVAFLSRKLS